MANPNNKLDDGPEVQVLADLGPDEPEIRKLLMPQAPTWTAIIRLNLKSPQSTMALSLPHSLLLYNSDENNTEAKY